MACGPAKCLIFQGFHQISTKACLPLVIVPITLPMGTLVTPAYRDSGLHSYTVKKCEEEPIFHMSPETTAPGMPQKEDRARFSLQSSGGRSKKSMRSKGQYGFSMVEMLIVVAIALAITALAVPSIMATIGNYRVTTSANAIAALIQETRMMAVRDNKCYSMESTTVGPNTAYFVDLAQNGTYTSQPFPVTNPQQREELVQLSTTVKIIAASSMPKQLTSGLIGGPSSSFTLDSTDAVSFNARGLPCLVTPPGCSVATSCQMLPSGNQIGFAYYLVAQPPFGPALYKGISITPAGRVRVWTLSGGTWQ